MKDEESLLLKKKLLAEAREFKGLFHLVTWAAAIDSSRQAILETKLAGHSFCEEIITMGHAAEFDFSDLPPANLVWLSSAVADAYDYIENFDEEWLKAVITGKQEKKIRKDAESLERVLSQHDLNFPRSRDLIVLLRELLDQSSLALASREGDKTPRWVAVQRLYSSLVDLFPSRSEIELKHMVATFLEKIDDGFGVQQADRAAKNIPAKNYRYSIKRKYEEAKLVHPEFSDSEVVEVLFNTFAREQKYNELRLNDDDFSHADALKAVVADKASVGGEGLITREYIREVLWGGPDQNGSNAKTR